MGIVKRAGADPLHDDDEGDIDAYETDISTDTSGNGSSTVSWAEDFANGSPKVIVTGDDDGDFYVSARGSSQCTVNVSGSSTTSGSVTAYIVAIGKRE